MSSNMWRSKKITKPYGDPHHQKRSPNHINKEASWPNLPQRLIKHISNNPNTLKTINFGFTTKSWKLKTPTTTRHNNNNNNRMIKHSSSDHRQTTPQTSLAAAKPTPVPALFCDIEFRRDYWDCWYRRNRPYRNKYPFSGRFSGCSHGIFFARGTLDPNTLYYFPSLESWRGSVQPCLPDNIPVRCAALSQPYISHANRRNCIVMVVTGISSPAFMFLRLKARSDRWTKQACSVIDPNYHLSRYKKGSTNNGDDHLMKFMNLIGFEGRFYALSCQGTLAVIEQVGDGDSDDRFEVTALGKTRAVPSVPFRGFKECLIESDGEILLVLLTSVEAKTEFDLVEVYRLRFEDHSWIKMKSLGERTLFLGNDCCVSVCAEKVGCRVNCVYFMQRGSDFWFEFDMEFGGISRAWTDRAILSSGNLLEWDEPADMSREEPVYVNSIFYILM